MEVLVAANEGDWSTDWSPIPWCAGERARLTVEADRCDVKASKVPYVDWVTSMTRSALTARAESLRGSERLIAYASR